MQAIETRYSGILFRSRLEARWALYFDLLGIEWLYEMEGFKLESGEIYLPDFYLPPPLDIFCEVKPYKQTDNRWNLFTNEHKLLLLFGKVNSYPLTLMYKSGEQLVVLAHVDSDYAPIYYARM